MMKKREDGRMVKSTEGQKDCRTGEPALEPVGRRTDGPTDTRKNGRKKCRTDGGRTNERKNTRTDLRTGGPMER